MVLNQHLQVDQLQKQAPSAPKACTDNAETSLAQQCAKRKIGIVYELS
jgi:hypothetical protein